MKTKIVTAAAGVSMLLAASLSYADGDAVPNNSARIGAYYITYHTSADPIAGPFVPAGLNIKLEPTTTLYLAYVRRLSEHFDLEFAFGVPPKTKTKGKGPAFLGSVPFNEQVISTAKWASPTLLLNYKFLDDTHALRPYVGIGVNHTIFFDRQSTAAGNAVSGGPTSVQLKPSTGIAGTIGLSYHVKDAWNVYASYSASKVTSDLSANTAGLTRTSRISFNPRAFVLSVGYSF
jgi:outer membrane protein